MQYQFNVMTRLEAVVNKLYLPPPIVVLSGSTAGCIVLAMLALSPQ
jgi:hypothetical protein